MLSEEYSEKYSEEYSEESLKIIENLQSMQSSNNSEKTPENNCKSPKSPFSVGFANSINAKEEEMYNRTQNSANEFRFQPLWIKWNAKQL